MSRNTKRTTRNNFELSVLKSLKALRTDVRYEAEELEYTITKQYIPDFVVTRKDGSKLYIEAKGYMRPEMITKMKAVKRCHPELDIRFVFQQNNKIRGTKMKYTEWAKKYGFPSTVGSSIPKEWL